MWLDDTLLHLPASHVVVEWPPDSIANYSAGSDFTRKF